MERVSELLKLLSLMPEYSRDGVNDCHCKVCDHEIFF